MDHVFAIAGDGFAGTVLKPVALALAMVGGVAVPGPKVEPVMQPEPRPAARPATQLTQVAHPFATGSVPKTQADWKAQPDLAGLPEHKGILADAVRPVAKTVPGSFKTGERMLSPKAASLISPTPPMAPFKFSPMRGLDEHAASGGQLTADMTARGAKKSLSAGSAADIAALTDARPEYREIPDIGAAGTVGLVAYDPIGAKPASISEPNAESALPSQAQSATLDFVAIPVVQALPALESTEQLIAVTPKASPSVAAQPVTSAQLAKPATPIANPSPIAAKAALSKVHLARPAAPTALHASQAATPKPISAPKFVSGKAMRGYRINDDAIEFSLSASVNGEVSGAIPLRVTRDDRLWLRLGDLLTLVKTRMEPNEFERLSASVAMDEYVTFETVRRAGIALQYDAGRNRVAIGVD